jgi:putative endonuclease
MAMWQLYLIRCEDGSLYTGITTDVSRRLHEHQNAGKKASKYLRGKGALTLVYQKQVEDRSEASKLEYAIKQLSKLQKEQLVAGQLDIRNLQIG